MTRREQTKNIQNIREHVGLPRGLGRRSERAPRNRRVRRACVRKPHDTCAVAARVGLLAEDRPDRWAHNRTHTRAPLECVATRAEVLAVCRCAHDTTTRRCDAIDEALARHVTKRWLERGARTQLGEDELAADAKSAATSVGRGLAQIAHYTSTE